MHSKILVIIPDQKLFLETDLSTQFFFYVLLTSSKRKFLETFFQLVLYSPEFFP